MKQNKKRFDWAVVYCYPFYTGLCLIHGTILLAVALIPIVNILFFTYFCKWVGDKREYFTRPLYVTGGKDEEL